MKIDWKRKLTSRKFWTAIVGFITPLLLAFSVSTETVTQVTSIIMSTGALIAYIIGEGLADSNSSNNRLIESDDADGDKITDDFEDKNNIEEKQVIF